MTVTWVLGLLKGVHAIFQMVKKVYQKLYPPFHEDTDITYNVKLFLLKLISILATQTRNPNWLSGSLQPLGLQD